MLLGGWVRIGRHWFPMVGIGVQIVAGIGVGPGLGLLFGSYGPQPNTIPLMVFSWGISMHRRMMLAGQ